MTKKGRRSKSSRIPVYKEVGVGTIREEKRGCGVTEKSEDEPRPKIKEGGDLGAFDKALNRDKNCDTQKVGNKNHCAPPVVGERKKLGGRAKKRGV